MKIVVLTRQTPDTESIIRISKDGGSVVTEDFNWILNPYDEFAVEAALRLKERFDGNVTVVSCGPQRVVESIRTALAMGADEGVLIDDVAMDGGDSLSEAKALVAALREIDPDIVLCGHRAVDYDLGQRGPMVAELLDWPHLGMAVSIDSDGSKVIVERLIEDGRVTAEADFPVLITMGGAHGVWNPRYVSLPGIIKSKKKPLSIKSVEDLGLTDIECGKKSARIKIAYLEMPSERKTGVIINGDMDTAGKAGELVRILREDVNII